MWKSLPTSLVVIGTSIHAQQVIKVPQNNAIRIVKAIESKQKHTINDQHRYLLALYHAGKLKEALQYYSSIEPKIVGKKTRIIYVRCLLELGLGKQAYLELKKLDDKRNPDLQIDFLKGLAMVKLKEWRAAETLFQLVLRVNPNHAEAHYYFGLTLRALGHGDKAITHWERVWEIMPRDSHLSQRASAVMMLQMIKQGQIKAE